MLGRGFPGQGHPHPNPSPGGRGACSAEPCSAGAFPAKVKSDPSPALPLASPKGGGVVPSHARQGLSQPRSKATPPQPSPWLRQREGACSAEPCSARAFPAKAKSDPSPALPLASPKGGGVVPSHARQGLSQPRSKATPPQPSPWPAAKGRGRSAEPCSAGLAQPRLEAPPPQPSPWLCQREGADAEHGLALQVAGYERGCSGVIGSSA